MKTFAAVAVCLLFFGALSVQAQEQAAPSPAPPSATSEVPLAPKAIDPAKAADIQRLLEVAGMKSLMQQTMTAMEASLRPNLEKSLPPGEYRSKLIDLFFERFNSQLNLQTLLDMATAAYDKYFSDDDIKGLIQFYQTPLGQRTLAVLPKLTAELQTESAQKGEQLGRDSMMEVLSEHPDLAQALRDAAQGTAPPPR
jgi:uncharacterized protein